MKNVKRKLILTFAVALVAGIFAGCNDAGNRGEDIALLPLLRGEGPAFKSRTDAQSGPVIISLFGPNGAGPGSQQAWHQGNVDDFIHIAFETKLKATGPTTVYLGEKITYVNSIEPRLWSMLDQSPVTEVRYQYKLKDPRVLEHSATTAFNFIAGPNPAVLKPGVKLGMYERTAVYQCPYKVVSDLADFYVIVESTIEVHEIVSVFPPVTVFDHSWKARQMFMYTDYPLNCVDLGTPIEDFKNGGKSDGDKSEPETNG